ncbi:MAG TPA: TonB-dependent receptor [Steroidobacteraceae bacterium]|nr:TonB-dependent receptor [Steroidobacteraceae bacterium]
MMAIRSVPSPVPRLTPMRGAMIMAATALLAAAALAPRGAGAQQAASEAPASAAPSGGLEEIVVTASKREERLENVPASITALSADALATQGVTDFSDYMTLVPSMADFSGGSEGHGAIILRGLNTGYYQTSNTVGYYIDDIPFSATSPLSVGALLTLDPDLSDIDHLEVLKGPQATLYGASTLGGLIKVVTNAPDLNKYGGQIQLEGTTLDHGSSGYSLVGVANLALIPDSLAVRVSLFDRDIPGYMTNVELGDRDRGVSRKEGGRISIRWKPTDSLDVRLSAFTQDLKVDGWNYEYVNLATLAPITGPYTYSSQYEPSFHTTYTLYNATVNYTAGPLGTLTNSASYGTYTDREIEDYSQYYGFLNAYAPAPVPADAGQPLFFGPTLAKLSDELRFTSTRMGGFEWLAGYFFTREQVNYPVQFYNTIPPSLQPIPGPSSDILGVSSPATYKENALFADLTYYFSDALDLTLGGRYSHNEQAVTAYNYGFASSGAIVSGASSDTDWTYLATLSYRPAAGLNTYARIATSYRPGGPELTPEPGYTSFKPDSLTNYEVGFKGDWWENRLRTNLALYYMLWKDVQMSFVDNDFDVISNGGRATSKGVELETQFVPVERLTLGLNVAYTDARLESVSLGVSEATGAVAGDALPFTPTWAGSATADYALPLNAALTSTYGATFRYQGTKWSDYPDDPNNTGVVIPSYDTVDLRAGLAFSRYKIQAHIANLFNAQGFDTVVQQRISPGNPPAWASIIPPRTFGLSFTATF